MACLLMTGCGAATLAIPRPTDQLVPAPPPPVLEPSRLSFQLDLPVSRLRDAAEGAVPREVGHEDAWIDVPLGLGGVGAQIQYRLWRDGLNFEMAGDRLVTRLDLRYRVRGRLAGAPALLEGQCGHSGESPRRFRIAASSALAWTSGWGLRSTTAFGAPDFVDSCLALPGPTDVTPLLTPVLEPGLAVLARTLDSRIAELAVARDQVAAVWERLATPIEVAPGTWVALRPRSAQAGPIVGVGPGLLRTGIVLTAEPLAKLDRPPDPEARPLPALDLVAAPARAFHVALPLRVPYAAINQRLAETVVGMSVDVGASQPLSIVEIQAYGSGPQVILQVGVTGAARGVVYLAGTPVLDHEAQVLRLDGLQFSVESDSALVRATGRLLHRRLVAQLEPRARLTLAQRLESIRARLGAALNRELLTGVDLGGTVDRLELRGVYPVQDGLEVIVVFGGALRLVAR